jgi:hypothetical protein
MTENISHLPELVRNITADPEQETAKDLHAQAQTLLEDTAVKTKINGISAVVSEYTHEVTTGDKKLYARLARYRGRKQPSELFFVFGESEQPKDITAKNPLALAFYDMGGEVSLRVTDGAEQFVDDEQYERLATNIVEKIDAERAAVQAKPKGEETDERKNVIRSRIIIGAAAIGIAYGHLLFNHVDAKIGPIPLPGPVEYVVDWNNIPDHRATGFAEPIGALHVKVGMPSSEVSDVPTLLNYDTGGAPDASTFHSTYDYRGENSHPGLYESNFNFSTAVDPIDSNASPAAFNDGSCYTINGDFEPGKTEIFSQSPNFTKKVTLDVVSPDKMMVCKKDARDVSFDSSIFIYQKP